MDGGDEGRLLYALDTLRVREGLLQCPNIGTNRGCGERSGHTVLLLRRLALLLLRRRRGRRRYRPASFATAAGSATSSFAATAGSTSTSTWFAAAAAARRARGLENLIHRCERVPLPGEMGSPHITPNDELLVRVEAYQAL